MTLKNTWGGVSHLTTHMEEAKTQKDDGFGDRDVCVCVSLVKEANLI